MEKVICEIYVVMGERTAHIVVLAAAFFHKALEFRYDNIVAAFARIILTEMVVDFSASIQAENDVMHFFIEEIHYFFIEENAVYANIDT